MCLLFSIKDAYSQKRFYKTVKLIDVKTDYAKDVVSTQDGSYVYLFRQVEIGGSFTQTLKLVKTDSIGSFIWSTAFTTTEPSLEPFSMIEMKNGDFTIVGKLGFDDTFVLRVDKNGIYKWVKKYHSFNPVGYYSIEAKAINTEDDGIAITGMWALPNANKGTIYLLKLNSDGEVQWANILETQQRTIGYDLVENANNELIVVGSTMNEWSDINRIYGAKFSAQGQNIWSKDFGIGNLPSISLTSQDEYIISAVGQDTLGFIFRINDQGGVEWGKKLSALNQYVHIKQSIKSKNYRLVYGGYALDPKEGSLASTSRGVVCELSGGGDVIWAKKYGVVDFNSGFNVKFTDAYMRIAVAPDGGYILTGNDEYFYKGEMYMIKTDSKGEAGCNSLDDLTFKTSDLTINSGNSVLTSPIIITTLVDTFTLVSSSVEVNTVCATVSANEIASNENIRLFPNPANDFVTISTADSKNINLTLKVFNTLGIQCGVYQFYHSNVSSIDISSLPQGQYFYELTEEHNILARGILVVMK